MAETKINSSMYTLLWAIVIVLLILVFVSHIIFMIGTGRWECSETKLTCNACEVIHDDKLSIKDNPHCECFDYKEVCVKEVWTRRLKVDG